MQKKIKISLYLFITIVILPTFIFSLYEISSVSQSEKIIEEIYTNQLESVLFSINQYTDEVISDWTQDLSYIAKENDNEACKTFIRNNPSIKNVFRIINSEDIKPVFPLLLNEKKELSVLLESNRKNINKLIEYLKNGYRKPEPYSFKDKTETIIFFAYKDNNNKYSLCGIILHNFNFIDGVLGPKIQEISMERFNILVFKDNESYIVYNTERNDIPEKISVKNPLWLIPGYEAGISLKDKTISELVKSRSGKFLYLIITINLILLAGVFMLFKNMKGELELSQIKSEFVSNVSHEIRTPLALVQMYIESLEMGRVQSADKQKEYYNIILQETNRLSGIVNKILNFTQIEKGKKSYHFKSVDINNVIERVITTYSFHLDKKGFGYHVLYGKELPIIEADDEAITESVINLIDNAVKYSDQDKSVSIKTGTENDFVYVEVEDQGIGISEKDQKYIFDKFYRVTTGDLALKAKGTGLGLTIVKHVMDAHNGIIKVESKKGKGSTFRLLFPIKYY